MIGRHRPRVAIAGALMLTAACSASNANGHPTTAVPTATVSAAPPTTVAPTTTPATTPATAPATTSTTRPVPDFAAAIEPVTAAELGRSYHAGCPVGPVALRGVRVSYWGFGHIRHVGSVVVHREVAATVVDIFRDLYWARFEIRMLQSIEAFEGNDNASMAADNTSGFNCRLAVATGPPRWSAHAYGKAIDVNPLENPYVEAGVVRPPGGAAFLRRSDIRQGMTGPGTAVNPAFERAGWLWGGRWSATPDYQHFSADGG